MTNNMEINMTTGFDLMRQSDAKINQRKKEKNNYSSIVLLGVTFALQFYLHKSGNVEYITVSG